MGTSNALLSESSSVYINVPAYSLKADTLQPHTNHTLGARGTCYLPVQSVLQLLRPSVLPHCSTSTSTLTAPAYIHQAGADDLHVTATLQHFTQPVYTGLGFYYE